MLFPGESPTFSASRNDHRNFNVSHAPFHARGLALETAVCCGTFILFKILGYTIVAVYSLMIHLYHAILIMVLSYVYKYDRVPFFDNLPNASCCSTII